MALDGGDLRARLGEACLMLVFTPDACAGRPPLEVLEAVLEFVDVVQVRPKAADRGLDPRRPSSGLSAVTEARAALEWTERVLEVLAGRPELHVPVLVNDRVDVARTLAGRGCAGVHLGQDDMPAAEARALLGPGALIGLSTHSPAQVLAALDEPVDYLGFGPVRASATKGYRAGLGAEAAWVADGTAHLPVFPIGGIEPANAGELERIGRAAVGSAVLAADDPAAAARNLRALLGAGQS